MSSSMEEDNTQTHTILPTFLRNKPDHKSLHVFRRSRRRWRRKEVAVKEVVKNDGGGCVKKQQQQEEEEEENDGEEIERKIHALQRIVPGGESLDVDQLFDETAGYILALQCQAKALRALTGFFEKLEKEKTKFGA
ncbi:Transcription factor PAR2 [Spatholobus suberectus]|nr:Transcription factor PAR2 [Spatholobus suberectus]